MVTVDIAKHIIMARKPDCSVLAWVNDELQRHWSNYLVARGLPSEEQLRTDNISSAIARE
jgi:hypothetical protein